MRATDPCTSCPDRANQDVHESVSICELLDDRWHSQGWRPGVDCHSFVSTFTKRASDERLGVSLADALAFLVSTVHQGYGESARGYLCEGDYPGDVPYKLALAEKRESGDFELKVLDLDKNDATLAQQVVRAWNEDSRAGAEELLRTRE